MIDDVIDPRETRATICRALEMSAGKRVERPCEAVRGGAGMSVDDPAIITCSISGAIANRDQCPAIPYTPAEYAAEARRIVDEGGVHIHIHARRPDGTPSYEVRGLRGDPRRDPLARSATPRSSTSPPAPSACPVEKRVAYLEACRPEVAALNMGSLNYAKYSRSRKDFVFQFVFTNPFDEIIELLQEMRRLGIKPEHECFDVGHVGSLAPLVDMGLLEAPLHADFVMGVTGGRAADGPQPGDDGREPGSRRGRSARITGG